MAMPSLIECRRHYDTIFLKMSRGFKELIQHGGTHRDSVFDSIDKEMDQIRFILNQINNIEKPYDDYPVIALEIITNLYFYLFYRNASRRENEYTASLTREGMEYIAKLLDPLLPQTRRVAKVPSGFSPGLMARACNAAGYLTYWAGDRWKMGARKYWVNALKFCSDIPSEEKGQALLGLSYIESESGRFRKGVERAEQALEVFTAMKDDLLIADGLTALGWAQAWCDESEKAVETFRAAVSIYRQKEEKIGLLEALNGLVAETAQLMSPECRVFFQEGIELARSISDRATDSAILHNFAWYLIDLEYDDMRMNKQNLKEVKRCFNESWRMDRETGFGHGIGYGLEGAACVVFKEGIISESQEGKIEKWRRAARLFGAAQGHRENVGDTLTPADQKYYNPMIKQIKIYLRHHNIRFNDIWGEGKKLALEDLNSAIQYSIDEADEEVHAALAKLSQP